MKEELERLRIENLELRNQLLEEKVEKLTSKLSRIDERNNAVDNETAKLLSVLNGLIEQDQKRKEGTQTHNAKINKKTQTLRNYPPTLQYKYNIKKCVNGKFLTNKNRIVALPLLDIRYLKQHFNKYTDYTTTQLKQVAKELHTSLNTLQRVMYNIEIGTFDQYI